MKVKKKWFFLGFVGAIVSLVLLSIKKINFELDFSDINADDLNQKESKVEEEKSGK